LARMEIFQEEHAAQHKAKYDNQSSTK
jgi:hypothetical protein